MTKTEITKLIRQDAIVGGASKAIRQLLLRHGTFCSCQADIRQNAIALQWKRRFRPKPKRCFYNSQKFAKENPDVDIAYWEGVVSSSGHLFLHAWNSVGDELIDLTLTNKDTAYFGIKIDRDFLFDYENQRWDNPPFQGGLYLPEYFKDERYKDYPLLGTEI